MQRHTAQLYRRSLLRAQPIASSSRRFASDDKSTRTERLTGWLRGKGEELREKVNPTIREAAKEEEIQAAQKQRLQEGSAGIFEEAVANQSGGLTPEEVIVAKKKSKVHTEHKYSTTTFKISPRKLNDLGRQISGQPIDSAILQMQFSEKRASKKLKSMLVVARAHAVNYKNLDRSKLIVSESWVTKGPNYLKRFEARGRGHFGFRTHPDAKMTVILKEGKTFAEKAEAEMARKLKRIVGPSHVRFDKPLRNPGHMWAW